VSVLRALLWDVDGTLAETERDGHRVAFNRAFEAVGLPWRWDELQYGQLLRVTGGRERLLHDMATRPDAPADRDALARELHRLKTGFYAEIVATGAIPLRPGVRELLTECSASGLRLAITTTTSRANVLALLAVSGLRGFEALLCAEEAPRKKPDPQVFARALGQLALPASETLAVEDSPAGLAACQAAGVPVVHTRSEYFPAEATGGPGLLASGPGLHTTANWQPPALPGSRIDLQCLEHWRATSHAN
jgi:HAD superfamily hydrolase (TIGR01509 family)